MESETHTSPEPFKISQDEHPLLGIPFYFLHPCGTENLLEEVGGSASYLLSWLSVAGPAVGLFIPLQFFTKA